MKISSTAIVLIIVLAILLLLLIGGCTLSCSAKKEGYRRSSFGQQCGAISRTPVDYVFKSPDGARQNPHYKADPSNWYQPLEQGPVDTDKYTRELNDKDGILFQQYRNDWPGPSGSDDETLSNDEKGRMDYGDAGDTGLRRQMDNVHGKRYGPKGKSNTEFNRIESDPHLETHRLYGGYGYHVNNKYGD